MRTPFEAGRLHDMSVRIRVPLDNVNDLLRGQVSRYLTAEEIDLWLA